MRASDTRLYAVSASGEQRLAAKSTITRVRGWHLLYTTWHSATLSRIRPLVRELTIPQVRLAHQRFETNGGASVAHKSIREPASHSLRMTTALAPERAAGAHQVGVGRVEAPALLGGEARVVVHLHLRPFRRLASTGQKNDPQDELASD